MKQFKSYDKMSKLYKKKVDSLKRACWEFSPVTRVKPSAKLYKREKVLVRDYT